MRGNREMPHSADIKIGYRRGPRTDRTRWASSTSMDWRLKVKTSFGV